MPNSDKNIPFFSPDTFLAEKCGKLQNAPYLREMRIFPAKEGHMFGIIAGNRASGGDLRNDSSKEKKNLTTWVQGGQTLCITMKRLQERCQCFAYDLTQLLVFKTSDVYAYENFFRAVESNKKCPAMKGMFNEEKGS